MVGGTVQIGGGRFQGQAGAFAGLHRKHGLHRTVDPSDVLRLSERRDNPFS